MIVDQAFNFAVQQAISGNSDTVSTNVLDITTAGKAFGGGGRTLKISVQFTAITGTNPTMRARFVGADNAGLSTNPIILADTGVSRVVVAGDNGSWFADLAAFNQVDAKRFYGVIFTMGGTTPAANVNAQGVLDSQSAGAPNLANIA